ncbi:MAG: AMP-binding protein, partial [Dehalococcoidia bacterium]
METLVELLEKSAAQYGDRQALVMRTGIKTIRLSYTDLEQRAHAFARLGREQGLEPGDRVVIWSANHPDWVAAMFGTFLAGGVVVPLDVRSSKDFVSRVIAQTEPRLAFAGHAQADVLRELEVPSIEFETLDLAVNGRAPVAPLTGDSLAQIIYTSGTTGDPKGVMLTHRNIAANVEAGGSIAPIDSGTRMLSLLPLSHMFEQVAGCFVPLDRGAAIAYPMSRQPSSLLRLMQDWKPTVIMGVPQVWTLLMNGIEREAAAQGKTKLVARMRAIAPRLPFPARRVMFRPILSRFGGHLGHLLSGGAALDVVVGGKWEAMGVAVMEGYGATECSPVISGVPSPERRMGSVGRALPGEEMRIASDGEVQVRGPNVFSGYWKNPAATEAAFEDGWYKTGDLGEMVDGQLRLKGRKKDLIVLADGQNVYPEDIERELVAQPGITDAVALGLEQHGEVRIHAVLLEQSPGDGARAVRDANALLTDRQQVLGFTTWPDEDFPRTHTLKVKRPLVLAYVQDHASLVLTPPPAADERDPLLRLVAQCARNDGAILEGHALGTDLALDSLSRVELLSAIEEELGVFVDDSEIGPRTTVAELRAMIDGGERRPKNHSFPSWPRWRPVRYLRRMLVSGGLFPLLWPFYAVEIRGRANFRNLSEPCLVISNHNMHLDQSMLLRAMPRGFRQRVAIAAAASDIFGNRVRGFGSALLGNAFPFAKEGSGVRESLEYVGKMLDEGWNVLIFPEGKLTVVGPMQPFKGGIGLLARESGVNVLPMRIDVIRPGFYEGKWFPHPRARVRVSIGKPITVPPRMGYAEATALLEEA